MVYRSFSALQSITRVPGSCCCRIPKHVVLLAMVLALGPACSVPEREQQVSDNTVELGSRQVIFDEAQTKASLETLRNCSGVSINQITGVWQPSPGSIQQLETHLSVVLEAALDSFNSEFGADEYYRQYLGVVQQGRPLILVNGFHQTYLADLQAAIAAVEKHGRRGEHSPDEWMGNVVSICDAGLLQFHVFYDPATTQFTQIKFSDRLTGRTDRGDQ